MSLVRKGGELIHRRRRDRRLGKLTPIEYEKIRRTSLLPAEDPESTKSRRGLNLIGAGLGQFGECAPRACVELASDRVEGTGR
ncbi:hypothetical protein NIBR502770_05985 [Pseudarthrobacter sp. NIBRBAC000502770]|nr:hypothetical protein NIBR502770_05985 [Pseudarthrobacter sp. NIBRBAC000502770]